MRLTFLSPGALASALALLGGCSGDDFTSKGSSLATDAGNGGADGRDSSVQTGGGATAGGGGGTTAGSGGAPSGGTGNAAGTGGGVVGTGGAVTVVEAGPPRWCDGQTALFCEDFDGATTASAFLSSWTTYSAVGGRFTFDTGADVPSPPNALKVSTTTDKNVQTLVLKTLEPFAAPPNKLRLEFALRVDAAADVGFLSGAAFAGLIMGRQVADGVVALAAGPKSGTDPSLAAAYVEPQNTGFNSANARAALTQSSQWNGHYALEIDYSTVDGSRTGCVRVLLAEVDQLPQCLALPPSLIDPPFVSVALGVYSAGLGNTGNVVLRFDNVVVTVE